MGHTLYELDVRLREIEPPIWRTIEIPGASSLEDVHYAIQVAMGWTNSHLHQFKIADKVFGMVGADDTGDLELEDERQYRLQDLVEAGSSFLYEYDFGDCWEHDVIVKKLSTVAKPPRPRCTAGARACPPEDCGGYGGYQNVLEAIADPNHDEHEDLVRWAGDFRPEHFAIAKPGTDLRNEMAKLKALADGDDEVEAGLEIDQDEMLDLPKPLVQAVLALDPMQRAALAALVAGSLATELTELRSVVGQLATQRQQQRKSVRNGRKRARS